MSAHSGQRRVVITGMGCITAIGHTVPEFWESLRAGRTGIGPITNFDIEDLYITIAGEVKGFDPRARITNKLLLLADRYSQFAGVAAAEAVAQSGIGEKFPQGERAACVIGTGAGGLNTLETAYRDLYVHGKKATHPLTLLRTIGSSACAHVGMDYGIKGPTFATMSACSTASHAIGLVFQFIRSGLSDLGLAGAAEATLNYGAMRSWQAMRVLSPDGLFPFCRKRNGTVLAEGAGVLMLEELTHAQARGAVILGEVMGFGMTSDAADMVNPDITGPSNAMRIALADAGLPPEAIDYLNAHGTATAVNDANETRAIRGVFGAHADRLSVSSTKGMHGHLLGAGGAVEAIVSVMAIREGFVPPTVGYREADAACDLDCTPNAGKPRAIRYAMSNSFAFGGLNAVLVFGPPPA